MRSVISFVFFIVNTLIASSLIAFLALLRVVMIPINRVLVWIAEKWIALNNLNLKMFEIKWTETISSPLSRNKSYLVVANHQSWVDIVALQKTLGHRIPFMRFFLKSSLFYIPFMGLAWWALDFPFMKRFTREQIARHPELKGKDFATTHKACEKLRGHPVSILNFLEGTRFTNDKWHKQQSPYPNLLKPKAGGLAYVLRAMGDQFAEILDVTIFYPAGAPSMKDLFAGRVPEIKIDIRSIPIPVEFTKDVDYNEDADFRARFQSWVGDLWQAKQERILQLKSGK